MDWNLYSLAGYKEYDLDKEKILVYYYDNQGIAEYLSPACIGKELYENSVELLLKNNGGYQPCKEENKVCHAFALFGMVSENEGKAAAIASRLRFTDAIPKEVRNHNLEYYLATMLLDELLEPKPGTAEFYTYSPYSDKEKWPDSEGYWTYDYYIDGKTRKKIPDCVSRGKATPPSRKHQDILMELAGSIREYIKSKNGSCKVYPAPFAVKLKEDDNYRRTGYQRYMRP